MEQSLDLLPERDRMPPGPPTFTSSPIPKVNSPETQATSWLSEANDIVVMGFVVVHSATGDAIKGGVVYHPGDKTGHYCRNCIARRLN
jgi:hypothetical protein